MALDKGIQYGKEKRKSFRGGKAVDRTCRCHGGCPWCLGNRLYRTLKEQARIDEELKEFYKGESDDV